MFSLPFVIQNTCALGIAVNTYLDALVVEEDPISKDTKVEVTRRIADQIFIYAERYGSDIDKAFGLWDAVYEGIKVSGNLVKDRKTFDQANEWLRSLR
jgi:predicted glycosyltransferase